MSFEFLFNENKEKELSHHDLIMFLDCVQKIQKKQGEIIKLTTKMGNIVGGELGGDLIKETSAAQARLNDKQILIDKLLKEIIG